jgi:hypothetical protein
VADALNDPDNDSPWGPHRIFPLTVPADRLPVSALVLSDALDTEDPDYNREDALFMKTSFDPLTIQSLLMRKRGLIIIKGRNDNEDDFDVPALLGRHHVSRHHIN